MERYAIIIEKAAHNYSACVPELGMCGSRRDHRERLIREAIELHIEGLRLSGEPVPEPTSMAQYVEITAA